MHKCYHLVFAIVLSFGYLQLEVDSFARNIFGHNNQGRFNVTYHNVARPPPYSGHSFNRTHQHQNSPLYYPQAPPAHAIGFVQPGVQFNNTRPLYNATNYRHFNYTQTVKRFNNQPPSLISRLFQFG